MTYNQTPQALTYKPPDGDGDDDGDDCGDNDGDDGDDDDNDGGFDDDNGGWLSQHLLLPAAQHEQAPEEGEIGA